MVHEKPGFYSLAQARMEWMEKRSFGVKSADWFLPFAHCANLADAKALREKMKLVMPDANFEIVPDCMIGPMV